MTAPASPRGGMLGRAVLPSFETHGTLRFPAGSGRVGGKEGGWDPQSGFVNVAERRRPIGGVSGLRLGYPDLGSYFRTGI